MVFCSAMQYAEDFELPERRRIIVTNMPPVCGATEGLFLKARREKMLREYNHAIAIVLCQKCDEYGPYGEVDRVMLKVRRLVVKIGLSGLRNGLICDQGILHGMLVHKLSGTNAHRVRCLVARPWRTGNGDFPRGLIKNVFARRTSEALNWANDVWRDELE